MPDTHAIVERFDNLSDTPSPSQRPTRHRASVTGKRVRPALTFAAAGLASAMLGWSVNSYMGHSAPRVDIGQVEFFYRFPRLGDSDYNSVVVKLDDSEVDKFARTPFSELRISQDMPLGEVSGLVFTPSIKEDQLRILEKAEQAFATLERLLSKPVVDSSSVAHYALHLYDDTYGLEMLANLADLGVVKLPLSLDSATKIINKRLIPGSGLRLGPNVYYTLEGLQRIDKSLEKTAIFPFLALTSSGQYKQLLEVVRLARGQAEHVRGEALDQLNTILTRSAPFLPRYHRVRMQVLLQNDGDYPVSLRPDATIRLSGSSDVPDVVIPARIFGAPVDSAKSRSVGDTVFIANVIPPKASAKFTAESTIALDSLDSRVQNWKAAGILKAGVSVVQNHPPFGRDSEVDSPWATIDASAGLSRAKRPR